MNSNERNTLAKNQMTSGSFASLDNKISSIQYVDVNNNSDSVLEIVNKGDDTFANTHLSISANKFVAAKGGITGSTSEYNETERVEINENSIALHINLKPDSLDTFDIKRSTRYDDALDVFGVHISKTGRYFDFNRYQPIIGSTKIYGIQTSIGLDEPYLTSRAYCEETYLNKADAIDTYLSKKDANKTYLSKTDATTTYESKADASETYLTKTDASTTYEPQAHASETYLSKSDASTTYETQAHVSETYLSKADATGTYESKTNASNTYLSKTDASTTYEPITHASQTYETITHAAETYALKNELPTTSNGGYELADFWVYDSFGDMKYQGHDTEARLQVVFPTSGNLYNRVAYIDKLNQNMFDENFINKTFTFELRKNLTKYFNISTVESVMVTLNFKSVYEVNDTLHDSGAKEWADRLMFYVFEPLRPNYSSKYVNTRFSNASLHQGQLLCKDGLTFDPNNTDVANKSHLGVVDFMWRTIVYRSNPNFVCRIALGIDSLSQYEVSPTGASKYTIATSNENYFSYKMSKAYLTIV